ncbi:nck-associated protein 5 [Nematolebias whitei]|uniref:nck-associated protein 5 n=1 Tax=Nematolebias whitei TaxID=451745 RepID=UPI00189A4398|nr:nck-associated protein 5 [Nematolebias whitei]
MNNKLTVFTFVPCSCRTGEGVKPLQQMVTLQQNFSSMEETVRTLLQNQDSLEGPKVDPLDLMKAYKDKLLEEMWKQQDRGSEENPPDPNPMLERLRALEVENSALSVENDNQRKQYERCLDEVANQVVQALLTQKDLREECVKLRTRVFDLEQQNRILSVLFQQRVKAAAAPFSQEVQRNGKAGIPAGRWPSLLSLTCPRSSGSGSELSLSSAGSEYSSGSHTWADGRGVSKQCASSRDKRMSTGSVSSNHSASIEQTELGWKEGHIMKGLKRLQMKKSKEASSHASVSHCKDCMISNEGIYSFGVKSHQQGTEANKVAPSKTDAGIGTLDSDDPDDETSKLVNRESSGQPTKDHLCLDKLDFSEDDDKRFQADSVSLSADSGLFPSPDSDSFLFLEAPTLKPGESPTDSLTHLEKMDKNSLEKQKVVHDKTRKKIETRCNSLDSEPIQPVALDGGGIPLLKPVMGMNGAKARSQSFGARYIDRPSFNKSGKARRLQIEQQFSSAFGEPVSEEPERQSTITTIEEKVMLGIEENLQKSQEQEKTSELGGKERVS